MTAPSDLHPSARALYWYLQWKGSPITVTEAARESGIPKSTIYQAAQKFPQTFVLTGNTVGTISTVPSRRVGIEPLD